MMSKPTKPRRESEPAELVRIVASDLFAGRREIEIIHENEIYRLRITRNEKLILTK